MWKLCPSKMCRHTEKNYLCMFNATIIFCLGAAVLPKTFSQHILLKQYLGITKYVPLNY